jgi:hypothetical protein
MRLIPFLNKYSLRVMLLIISLAWFFGLVLHQTNLPFFKGTVGHKVGAIFFTILSMMLFFLSLIPRKQYFKSNK